MNLETSHNNTHDTHHCKDNGHPSRTFSRSIFIKKRLFLLVLMVAAVMPVILNLTLTLTHKGPVPIQHPYHRPATKKSFNETFDYYPSIDIDSMCNVNHDDHETLISYCEPKGHECMDHKVDVKEKLLFLSNSDSTNHHHHNVDEDGNDDKDQGGCKMLWFAAMHESTCGKNSHPYALDYSVALESALENARDTLEPILILGRYGLLNENSTESTKFGKWVEEHGVKVLYSPRLSFQEDIPKSKRLAMQQGPFLRLDIPKFIREHDLMDMPGVCQNHVLYTDADVVFANRITQTDVRLLTQSVGKGITSYGREFSKGPEIMNTGVMVIHVQRFEQELPFILQTGRDTVPYPGHDQELLNLYQRANDTTKEKFQLLPMQYNWKAYWGLEPSYFSQIKIVHFHGPKLGQGLEEMATCNVTGISSNLRPDIQKAYGPLLHQGICCDYGRTAKWSMKAIRNWEASMDDLCDGKDDPIVQT